MEFSPGRQAPLRNELLPDWFLYRTSLNQRCALSYTGNQLNLTANVIWGTHFDHVTDRPQCPAARLRPFQWLQSRLPQCRLDGQQKFGDWEFGVVAFGSTDLNDPIAGS